MMCHESAIKRFLPYTVPHMCHDVTSPAIMAGRLGAKMFCLPLAGIACHGLRLLTILCVRLLVPPDFSDTALSSAMCLWTKDVDIPVDIARQAILCVQANTALELSQHPSADCACLSKPLQELMVTAVRAVNGFFFFWVTGELSTLRQMMKVSWHGLAAKLSEAEA